MRFRTATLAALLLTPPALLPAQAPLTLMPMPAEVTVGAGRLHPFRAGKAAVRDNAGQEVIPAGQTLSDLQILQMNWLAEGVQGKLPR